jgi:hypothetical protein
MALLPHRTMMAVKTTPVHLCEPKLGSYQSAS